jgi:hypothetical protein
MVRKKVLSWGSDVDDKVLDDAARAASLPCVPSHVALMPTRTPASGRPSERSSRRRARSSRTRSASTSAAA